MQPYYRVVSTSAKGRWIGRSFGDILHELGPGAKLLDHDLESVVKPRDSITYTIHVHEPEVLQTNGAVIHQDDNYVVIDKPSGLPTHPTVNYFQNSVTERLRVRFGNLYPCYRLDRLTSGVLILARNTDAVINFHASKVHVRKRYLALVEGCMLDAVEVNLPVFTFNAKRGFSAFEIARKKSKAASTRVRPIKIMKDKKVTLVECEPLTGRMHQIRKHLAQIGHPIIDDPIYSDGLFCRLMADPSLFNFEALQAATMAKYAAKVTGQFCSECHAPLFKKPIGRLFLHCQEITFNGVSFEAAVPEWAAVA